MSTAAIGVRLPRPAHLRPLALAVGLLLCVGVLALLGLGVGGTGLESLRGLMADPTAAAIV